MSELTAPLLDFLIRQQEKHADVPDRQRERILDIARRNLVYMGAEELKRFRYLLGHDHKPA